MKPVLALTFAALLIACASTYADQPHMEAALVQLQQAKDNLQRASSDKGGHRAKAIRTIDQAIAETKAGIEYDRTHRSPEENRK